MHGSNGPRKSENKFLSMRDSSYAMTLSRGQWQNIEFGVFMHKNMVRHTWRFLCRLYIAEDKDNFNECKFGRRPGFERQAKKLEWHSLFGSLWSCMACILVAVISIVVCLSQRIRPA